MWKPFRGSTQIRRNVSKSGSGEPASSEMSSLRSLDHRAPPKCPGPERVWWVSRPFPSLGNNPRTSSASLLAVLTCGSSPFNYVPILTKNHCIYFQHVPYTLYMMFVSTLSLFKYSFKLSCLYFLRQFCLFFTPKIIPLTSSNLCGFYIKQSCMPSVSFSSHANDLWFLDYQPIVILKPRHGERLHSMID